MTLVVAWPSDTNMTSGGGPDTGYLHDLQWKQDLWEATLTLVAVGSWTQKRTYASAQISSWPQEVAQTNHVSMAPVAA